ncbi:MAG: hypothetical protein K8J08_16440 [Thermoanaerobaculia bacterium]|nr:hypothetical protein [Thermoanaerobaculia bacterium]
MSVGQADLETGDSPRKRPFGLAIALCLLGFPAAVVAVSLVSLYLGHEISTLVAFEAGLIVAGSLALLAGRQLGFWGLLRAASASLLVLSLAIALAAAMVDSSHDGRWYHKEAVLLLADGWNPVWEPAPVPSVGDSFLRRQLLEGYPKASWLYGATVLTLTGNLEATKSLALPLLCAAGLTTWAALGSLGVAGWRRLGTSLVATANPIVFSQLPTSMVDGLLASALLSMVAATILLIQNPSRISWGILVSSMVLACHLKATGPVFSVLLFGGCCLVAALQLGLRTSRPRQVAIGGLLALCFSIGVLGIHPFVTNWRHHGQIFYPIDQDTDDALELTLPRRLEALVGSAFSSTSVGQGRRRSLELATSRQRLKVPFTIGAEEWHYLSRAQHRVGGWGPLFGGVVLLAALAVMAQLGWTTRKRLALYASFTSLILLTVLVIPPCWIARFVPQSWWLVAGPIPLATRRLGVWRSLPIVVLVLASLLNSGLIGVRSLGEAVTTSTTFRSQLTKLASRGGERSVDYGIFQSDRFHLMRSRIEAKPVEDPQFSLDVVTGYRRPSMQRPKLLDARTQRILLRWSDIKGVSSYRLRVWSLDTFIDGSSPAQIEIEVHRPRARLVKLPLPLRIELSACNLLGCGPPTVTSWSSAVPDLAHSGR